VEFHIFISNVNGKKCIYLRVVNRHKQKPNFRLFSGIFSSVFGFFNTDVGVGFSFLKYRDIGFGYRLGSSSQNGARCCAMREMVVVFISAAQQRAAYDCVNGARNIRHRIALSLDQDHDF